MLKPQSLKPTWKSLVQSVFVLFIGIVGVHFMLSYFEEKMIFPGAMMRKAEGPLKAPLSAKRFEKELGEGQFVEAFLLPTLNESPQGLVVHAHGNGELIDDWVQALSPYYIKLGYHLLLVEYRGYGRSAGTPNEKNLVEDFKYFVNEALKVTGNVDKVVFHGRSIGGGVVSSLIGQSNMATHLILESTFTSLTQRAWEMLKVPGILIKNQFNNIKNLENFNGPTLVIHGKKDTLIPFHHGEQLKDSVKNLEQFLVLDCGHNDCLTHREDYWQSIENFLVKQKN